MQAVVFAAVNFQLLQTVVVVVISFTLTSPLRGYAGYHNYGYPNLTTVNVQITCRRILCLVGACVIQTDFDPPFVLLSVPDCKISLMLLQNPVLHLPLPYLSPLA